MTPLYKRILLGIIPACTVVYLLIYQGTRTPLETLQLQASSLLAPLRGTVLHNCSHENQTHITKCICSTELKIPNTDHQDIPNTLKPGFLQRIFEHKTPSHRKGGVKRSTKAKGPHGEPPAIPDSQYNETVLILMLSYQRSGSSFMGNLMNRNPSIFYVYEPLDALYSSMYGIPPGWSVPSDITGNSDGTVKQLPKHEVLATADTITNLLTCQIDKLPKEAIISQFWLQFWDNQLNLLDFTKCLHQNKINGGKCQSLHLRRYCAPRIGIIKSRDEKCRDILSHKTAGDPNSPQGRYLQCILQQNNAAAKCIPALKNRCLMSPVRGTKTVRATMEMASVLLERHPNLKVLHLFRDPRSVLLSRQKHLSFRSNPARNNIVIESKFYCGIVESDIKLRNTLMEKHPNRIKEIIYENVVRDPIPQAKAIYEFLGIKFPEELHQWLQFHTKKPSHVVETWKNKTKERGRKEMEHNCRNLLNYGSHVWEPTS